MLLEIFLHMVFDYLIHLPSYEIKLCCMTFNSLTFIASGCAKCNVAAV